MPAVFVEGMRSAMSVAAHLRNGGQLVSNSSGMRLDSGEVEYAQVWTEAARYHSIDNVTYQRTSLLALGSTPLLVASVATSALVNSSRRRKAESMAAAQWRPMGTVGVTITSHRLLVLHEMAWESIWFSQMIQIVPDVTTFGLDVIFEGAPPYHFGGPSAPYLSVILVFLLYGEVLLLPSHEGIS